MCMQNICSTVFILFIYRSRRIIERKMLWACKSWKFHKKISVPPQFVDHVLGTQLHFCIFWKLVDTTVTSLNCQHWIFNGISIFQINKAIWYARNILIGSISGYIRNNDEFPLLERPSFDLINVSEIDMKRFACLSENFPISCPW